MRACCQATVDDAPCRLTRPPILKPPVTRSLSGPPRGPPKGPPWCLGKRCSQKAHILLLLGKTRDRWKRFDWLRPRSPQLEQVQELHHGSDVQLCTAPVQSGAAVQGAAFKLIKPAWHVVWQVDLPLLRPSLLGDAFCPPQAQVIAHAEPHQDGNSSFCLPFQVGGIGTAAGPWQSNTSATPGHAFLTTLEPVISQLVTAESRLAIGSDSPSR